MQVFSFQYSEPFAANTKHMAVVLPRLARRFSW